MQRLWKLAQLYKNSILHIIVLQQGNLQALIECHAYIYFNALFKYLVSVYRSTVSMFVSCRLSAYTG